MTGEKTPLFRGFVFGLRTLVTPTLGLGVWKLCLLYGTVGGLTSPIGVGALPVSCGSIGGSDGRGFRKGSLGLVENYWRVD